MRGGERIGDHRIESTELSAYLVCFVFNFFFLLEWYTSEWFAAVEVVDGIISRTSLINSLTEWLKSIKHIITNYETFCVHFFFFNNSWSWNIQITVIRTHDLHTYDLTCWTWYCSIGELDRGINAFKSVNIA